MAFFGNKSGPKTPGAVPRRDNMPAARSTDARNIDPQEVTWFDQHHAADWWEPKGSLKALHDINPLRFAYVAGRAHPAAKNVLDVGCGGGILSEALARAGARVTGIDLAESALAAARAHRDAVGLSIQYCRSTVEAMAGEMPGGFDIIVCMELLEHVPDPRSILRACRQLAGPGGDIFLSTINRTWMSAFLVILMAEYVLNIVEKGTHRVHKFIPPRQLSRWAEAEGLLVLDCSGFLYVPVAGRAFLTKFKPMNYMMHLRKAGDD